MRSMLACWVVVLSLFACSREDARGNPDGSALPDGGVPFDGSTFGYGPDLGYLCTNNTGPIMIPTTNHCTGDIARETFLFGLCSCTNIDGTSSSWDVTAEDSSAAMSMAAGAIAANGKFIGGAGNISGSLWVGGIGASSQPVTDLSTMSVKGDVHSGGDLTASGVGHVSGDAYISGAVAEPSGILSIDGKLHQPASSPAPMNVTPGGGVVVEPVAVGEPCNCSNPLQITPIVAAFANDNDDAILGLTPSSLSSFTSESLTLGCGRFYFDSIKGGTLQITAVGPTAIFVAGDIDTSMSISVASGGQLDLFVAGNVSLSGAWHLGSQQAPANTRIYIGGSTVKLDGAFEIFGNLYMPNVDLAVTQSAFQIYGSLYAHGIAINGIAAYISYDQAVQDLTGCQPAGSGCNSCHDCAAATPACKGGTCAKCTTDADCCAPLQCQPDGTCASPVL